MARWSWCVENAACLAALSFSHPKAAEDGTCDDERCSKERSNDYACNSTSRETRSRTGP
jgi:hypothetical protein